jgi:glycosyltransferase involved in cell wall biosynthesis
MKISIVTISYNQAEFLERAIMSIIDQDYCDFEYIVVDPGSTDGSRDIIERYSSKIDKIIFEPDKGPADGLNKGFKKARGEVYGFLNADDVLFMGTLSKVASFFKEHHDIGVVSAHSFIIDQNDRKLRNSYSDNFSLLLNAYGVGVLMQPSTFFKKNIFFRSGGFNMDNKTNWDGELFIDMALKGARFALVNEFWSGYRLHPFSITGSKCLDEGINAYKKNMFRKIMGRDELVYDQLLTLIFKVYKYFRNPRAFYERITKGPIYGSYVRE